MFVQAKNVYPGLLLARMFFSIGGAACTTMVTAILPSMTAREGPGDAATAGLGPSSQSVSSELTITPARVGRQRVSATESKSTSPTRVAGIVGTFTGCGALIALVVFLPLPTQFKKQHISDAKALMNTFYVVGTVALLVALACFVGLRKLRGEEHKSWRSIYIRRNEQTTRKRNLPYWTLLSQSVKAGYLDYRIGLGYLGGFVARASSVGISLFVPLAINTYFISSGRCKVNLDDPTAIKTQCREAYILSSQLTGISQLVALVCAPIFGYLADRYRRFEVPLLLAAVSGVLGYGAFAGLKTPEPTGDDGSPLVFVIVSLLGISQIGAIVCSLGLLGRGISGLVETAESSDILGGADRNDDGADGIVQDSMPGFNEEFDESSGLLSSQETSGSQSLTYIQGSIAGTYSLLGGAGILLLTKLGGFLFDSSTPAAPFIMMAIFNALLFIGVLANVVYRCLDGRAKP